MKAVKLGIGLVVGVLVLAVILVVVAVVVITRIDPNTYTPQLREQASQFGVELELDNIAFGFWPSLRLELDGLVISTQADDHAKLMQVGQASVSVKVLPLLQQKIAVDHVVLKQPSLWFHQFEDGTHNWQPLLPQSDQSAAEPAPSSSSTNLDFALDKISIEQAQLFVSGAQSLTINPLNLMVSDLALGQWVSLALDASAQDIDGFEYPVQAELQGKMMFDETVLQLETDLNISSQAQTLSLGLEGDVNAKTQALNLKARVKPVDVDGWMALLPQDQASAPEQPDNTDAAQESTVPTPLPKALLQGLDARLGLVLEEVVFKQQSHQLSLNVSAQKGVAIVSDVNFQAYNGQALGDVSLDVNQQPAALAVDLSLAEFEIARVLETFAGVVPMTGELNGKLDLTARGDTVEALIDELKGKSELSMAKPTLPKLQLNTLLANALTEQDGIVKSIAQLPKVQAEIERLKSPKVFRAETQLQDVLAKVRLTPEVVETRDLTATLNGQPINAQFSYGRQTQVISFNSNFSLPFENESLADIVWPLLCEGSLEGFGCKVNASAIKPVLKSLVKDEVKTKAKAKIDEKLAPEKEKAKEKLKDAEDKAKAKIEEKLGTDLKDFFGR